MGKITGIAVLAGVALAAAVSALDVGVGAFYAPARVVGYIDKTREYSDKEFSMGGVKGRVSVGIHEGLNVALGFGYNNLRYREEPFTIEEVEYVTSIPAIVTTAGVFYGFPLSPIRPYAGGGVAVARESAEAYGYTTTDWYPGVYVEGGALYFLTNGLALEAGPRYTLLFDEPVVYYDGWDVHDFVRSEHRTQLIELLFGINYYF